MAKASALLSSIVDASGFVSFNPYAIRKRFINGTEGDKTNTFFLELPVGLQHLQ